MLKLILLPILLLSSISMTTSPISLPTWVVGTWSCTENGKTTTESWTSEKGKLVGTSSTEKGGKKIITEQLRIEIIADAKLVYIAHPMGQSETIFTAVEVKEGFMAFENPEHDFPKRIAYTLESPDKLTAEILGQIGGGGSGMKWTFERVK